MNRVQFLNSIKVNKAEDSRILEIQESLENGEILLADLSDEEVKAISALYDEQIKGLKTKVITKKTELLSLKRRNFL